MMTNQEMFEELQKSHRKVKHLMRKNKRLKRKLAQAESERLRYRQMAQQYKIEIENKNKQIQLLKGKLDRSRREIVRLKSLLREVKKG